VNGQVAAVIRVSVPFTEQEYEWALVQLKGFEEEPTRRCGVRFPVCRREPAAGLEPPRSPKAGGSLSGRRATCVEILDYPDPHATEAFRRHCCVG
jgi:hypothetical protein